MASAGEQVQFMKLAANVVEPGRAATDGTEVVRDFVNQLPTPERVAFLTDMAKLVGEGTLAVMDESAAAGDAMDKIVKSEIEVLSRTVHQRATWVASKEVSRR